MQVLLFDVAVGVSFRLWVFCLAIGEYPSKFVCGNNLAKIKRDCCEIYYRST
jgi:hypothetical protein